MTDKKEQGVETVIEYAKGLCRTLDVGGDLNIINVLNALDEAKSSYYTIKRWKEE